MVEDRVPMEHVTDVSLPEGSSGEPGVRDVIVIVHEEFLVDPHSHRAYNSYLSLIDHHCLFLYHAIEATRRVDFKC